MAINVFTASGNVGADFEIRFTPAGKAIGSFPLPVKQGWGDNEKTSWVTCKMFGERAQKMESHITKGIKLTVSGSFVLDEWEHNGTKHSRPVIIVNDIDFGGSKPQGQNQQQGSYGNNQQRPQGGSYQQAPQQPQGGGQSQQKPPMSEPDFDDYSDDIPF